MKHPIISKASRITIWWLAWAVLAVGQSLLFYFVYNIPLVLALADGFVSMTIMGIIGIFIWFPLTALRSPGKVDIAVIVNFFVIGVLIVYIWITATRLAVGAFFTDKNDYGDLWSNTITYRIAAGVLLYGVVILTYSLLLSGVRLAEKASRQAQLEAMVKESELKLLRTQLNPHFLFNSLNSISSLTVSDPPKAREMIVKLSEFMRYSLSRKNEQPVILKQELENARLYLDIEKIRFSERLVFSEEISERCMNAMLPAMLLQPLFENAIKHGVYESTGQIIIKTTAVYESGNVILTVFNTMDSGVISGKKGTGTGLSNVAKRMELYYGNESYLRARQTEDSFTVTLTFPYKREDNK
jgi:two-component system, LytTR family, sensor kinase